MPRLHILFLTLLAAVTASLASSGPPHVIVILVDDMGYGDPGCYNPASKIPTPNIDRLAAERQLAWLIVDPAETTNRFAAEPGVVARLRAEMRKIVHSERSH